MISLHSIPHALHPVDALIISLYHEGTKSDPPARAVVSINMTSPELQTMNLVNRQLVRVITATLASLATLSTMAANAIEEPAYTVARAWESEQIEIRRYAPRVMAVTTMQGSDGDGFSDGEELAAGTDPANSQATPNRPPATRARARRARPRRTGARGGAARRPGAC